MYFVILSVSILFKKLYFTIKQYCLYIDYILIEIYIFIVSDGRGYKHFQFFPSSILFHHKIVLSLFNNHDF